MINFFRKIRKQLANENKFKKYFRYAFGEIVLVVLGILIALQVNNWNEKRKHQKEFHTLISKIYTIVNSNTQTMYSFSNRTIEDFRRLEYFINYKNKDTNVFKFEEVREHYTFDTLSKDPFFNFNLKEYAVDEIEPWKFPHLLYQLEQDLWWWIDRNTLKYYSDLLNPYPNSEIENQLALNIVTYFNIISSAQNLSQSTEISSFLKEKLIPKPRTVASTPVNINNLEKHYFTMNEINRVEKLLQEEPLKAELRALLLNKLVELDQIRYIHDFGNTILNSIKNEYPDIKFNYSNIGIIGNALDGWNAQARPMSLINPDSLIWEADIILKNGNIKFNSDNSWANSWGGSEFPKGRAFFFGDNIIVKPGKYHVILNLTENTYEFIKQE